MDAKSLKNLSAMDAKSEKKLSTVDAKKEKNRSIWGGALVVWLARRCCDVDLRVVYVRRGVGNRLLGVWCLSG